MNCFDLLLHTAVRLFSTKKFLLLLHWKNCCFLTKNTGTREYNKKIQKIILKIQKKSIFLIIPNFSIFYKVLDFLTVIQFTAAVHKYLVCQLISN
jgi:hypothetical protein